MWAPTWNWVLLANVLRVVAIGKDLGLLSMWNAFLPMDSLRALYQMNKDSVGVVQIMPTSPARAWLEKPGRSA